jgi:transitional endoplasmic reticulum ATPase
MGSPRTAHVRDSRRPPSQIDRWMAAIGLNAGKLIRTESLRHQVMQELRDYLRPRSRVNVCHEVQARRFFSAQLAASCRPATEAEAALMANMQVLVELLELNQTESQFLTFIVALQVDYDLQSAADQIDANTQAEFFKALSLLLGEPVPHLQAALSFRSPLMAYDIVKVDFFSTGLAARVALDADLGRVLASGKADLDAVMAIFCVIAPPSTLTLDDFAHLGEDVQLLTDYLRAGAHAGLCGVNVLLYGLPGTGKSELARLVAGILGWTSFEVVSSQEDGTSLTGMDRLRAYRLAQKYLARRKDRLLIFDEIEDVFQLAASDPFETRVWRRKAFGKLWMNRLLETNAVPTLWIANSLEDMEPAYLRRFDLAIAFEPLPEKARRKVLQLHLRGLQMRPDCVERLLRHEELLPSQVATAARVAVSLGGGADQDAVLARVIHSSMKLLGQPQASHEARTLSFDPSLSTADVDLAELIEKLKNHGRGRIWLAGPPGCGKTAFAHYAAQAVGRPLQSLKPSDLLSPFIGESEQQIGAAFRAAKDNNQVLLLDEAESFLRARDAAQATWELTLVNEMLSQTEAFDGLLLITTNVPEMLDPAVVRRFDLKIDFGYLRFEQRLAALRSLFKFEIRDDDTTLANRLRKLDRLTPGDYDTVRRKATILGARWGPLDWLAALESEQSYKPHSNSEIGFTRR